MTNRIFLFKDIEKWENNRMIQSGVVTKINIDQDFDDESESRVHLLVTNIVPPFLDGRIRFTRQCSYELSNVDCRFWHVTLVRSSRACYTCERSDIGHGHHMS
jgi:hypothetical protein